MEWFAGDIGDAVAKAKSTDACLVVFIEDGGESSKRLEALFTHEIIYKALNVSKFVAIRFSQDSETYMHFSSIYRLVPVPSIFFIRQNGTPIAIATGLLQTPEELQSKITDVLNSLAQNTCIPTTTSDSGIARAAPAVPTDCPGGVCTLPQRTKAKVIKPKKDKQDEDEAEVRRERDNNFKESQEQIRRDKLMEQQARERVRAQIAADRREQAQRHSITSVPLPTANVLETNAMPVNPAKNVRLQFRLPNGDTAVHVFEPNDRFSMVRDHVRTQVLGVGHHKFSLATSYPKLELGIDCDDKTLLALGLCPSAVILVIMVATTMQTSALRVRFDSVFTVLSNVFLAIFNPFFNFVNYLRNGTSRNGAAQHKKDDDSHGSNLDATMRRREAREGMESVNDATARRWAGGSNIHRLRDQTKKDDDDNATWNGNSTQQQ